MDNLSQVTTDDMFPTEKTFLQQVQECREARTRKGRGDWEKEQLFMWVDKTELTPRERKIVVLRLGIADPNGPMALEDIAELYDVTRERVRQIANRAIRKIREVKFWSEWKQKHPPC